jgi:hypothetical protein
VPCDWHLAIRSLQIPSNSRTIEVFRRSYTKPDGSWTCPIDKAQTEMAEWALEQGAEYILYIEDDTIPPPGVVGELGRILDNSPESVMVCGGIYTTRANPPEPIVYMGPGEGSYWKWKIGDVFPCWAIGFGCTMVRVKIFELMPKPWFKVCTDLQQLIEFPELFPEIVELFPELMDNKVPRRGVGISSDLFFFTKLRNMGFTVLAHGGVLPVHYDVEKNRGYWIPKGSLPTQGVVIEGKEYGWTNPDLELVNS